VIDHVTIRVADYEACKRFYDTVLPVLGKQRSDAPDYLEWGDLSIVPDDKPPATNLHLAFYAPTHELVDAFHRTGVEAGYTDDGAPGPRPQYREEYYGAFLRDPSGNSVEAVYTSRVREAGALDHMWLRTRDVAAAKRFYQAIGCEIGVDRTDFVQIVTANATFSFVPGEPLTRHVHIAFGVDTNEAVDRWHANALAAGYTDNGAPGERPQYHAGYYGAFVLDPDGHNIEAVNHNRTAASR
jgi:catechol 2,3-dioxygenase-like lactoylglutathione lyase family enzyme